MLDRFSLSAKFAFGVVATVFAVLVMSAIAFVGMKQYIIEEASLEMASKISNDFRLIRKVYSSDIVPAAQKAGLAVSHDYASTGGIPVPATYVKTLGEKIAEEYPGTSVKLVSQYPFSFRGKADLDRFQQDALAFLEKAGGSQPFSRLEVVNGRLSYRYAVADKMVAEACVTCHNSHPASPKKDWKLGDIRGALEVTVPIDALDARVTAAASKNGALLLVGLLVVVLAASVGLVMIINRRVTRPLANLVEQTESAVKNNDFSRDIPVAGEPEIQRVSEAFNLLMKKSRGVIAESKQSCKQIADLSKRLAESSANTAASSQRQASAAGAVAINTEQIAASLNNTSQHSETSKQLAADALSETGLALQKTRETRAEIDGIAAALKSSMDSVMVLSENSAQISGIVTAIQGVAEQTNLLALNAAIEAARAGEQGRGFAVVADEVRKLAERTAQSTHEIASLIDTVQTQIGQTVNAMRDANQQASHGVEMVREAESMLSTISHSNQEINARMLDIAGAAREQNTAVRDIFIKVEEIAAMSEANSADIATNSAATRQMDGLVQNLLQTASGYRID